MRLFTTRNQALSWLSGSNSRFSLDNKFQVAVTVLFFQKKKGMMVTKETKTKQKTTTYYLNALVSAEAIFHQKP